MSRRFRRIAYLVCMAGILVIVMGLFLPAVWREPPVRHVARHPVSTVAPLPTLGAGHLLNSGDAADLDVLPGVGEVLARRIIDMRDDLQGYILLEELIFVKGIGEKKMADIRDALTELEP